MLRGLPLVLFVIAVPVVVHAGEALDRARRALPPADRITLDRQHAAALTCSTRSASTQARISTRSAADIADDAWRTCTDDWAAVAFTFGQIREGRGEGGGSLDASLSDFGRAVDLLRRDWYAQAPAIISQARRTGPAL